MFSLPMHSMRCNEKHQDCSEIKASYPPRVCHTVRVCVLLLLVGLSNRSSLLSSPTQLWGCCHFGTGLPLRASRGTSRPVCVVPLFQFPFGKGFSP